MCINNKNKNMSIDLFSRYSSYFTALMILKLLTYFMHSNCLFDILDVFLKSLKTEQTSKLKTDQSHLKCLKSCKITQVFEFDTRPTLFIRLLYAYDAFKYIS